MWTYNYNNYELYHHGVKGMRWGVRRANRKAVIAEKKAARKAREAELTPEQQKKRTNVKRAVGIGMAAAGTAIAAFGAYKLSKAIGNNTWNKTVDIGRKKVFDEFKFDEFKFDEFKFDEFRL